MDGKTTRHIVSMMERGELYVNPSLGEVYRRFGSDVIKCEGGINEGHVRMRLGNGVRVYRHQVVWISVYGGIPDGCDIHHKDLNPLNDSIDNLVLMDSTEHSLYHSMVDGRDSYVPDNETIPCIGCKYKYYARSGMYKTIHCEAMHGKRIGSVDFDTVIDDVQRRIETFEDSVKLCRLREL